MGRIWYLLLLFIVAGVLCSCGAVTPLGESSHFGADGADAPGGVVLGAPADPRATMLYPQNGGSSQDMASAHYRAHIETTSISGGQISDSANYHQTDPAFNLGIKAFNLGLLPVKTP